MDPYRYDEGPTNQIMLHIYEAMVAQNADMSFGPCLAESWETSEDGLTWTFHLREALSSMMVMQWILATLLHLSIWLPILIPHLHTAATHPALSLWKHLMQIPLLLRLKNQTL